MSMSPPPPPGPPPGQGPYGFEQPGLTPPGFQHYGGPQVGPPRNAGMAVAALVLSLVGLIPCFWLFQIPGLLGTIFGFVGMSQTKDGTRGGRGMAIAGMIIGVISLVACVAFWIYFAQNADCVRTGTTWECTTN